MVEQYSHLFFYFFECEKRGDKAELKKVAEQKNLIFQELKSEGYDVRRLAEDLKIKKIFQKDFETVIVFSDGGVRNNHDTLQKSMAASAFAIYGDKQMLTHKATWIGNTIPLPTGETVNINSTLAEYHGLLQALLFLEKHQVDAKKVIFLTDCAAMVQHVSVKVPSHPLLTNYAQELRDRLYAFPNVELKFIPREHNKVTDALVNQLIDQYERSEVCA